MRRPPFNTQLEAAARLIVHHPKAVCPSPKGLKARFRVTQSDPTTLEGVMERLGKVAKELAGSFDAQRSGKRIRQELFEVETWASAAQKKWSALPQSTLGRLIRAGDDPENEAQILPILALLLGHVKELAAEAQRQLPASTGNRQGAVKMPTIGDEPERDAVSTAFEECWLLWNWWQGEPEVLPLQKRTDADLDPTDFENFLVAVLELTGAVAKKPFPHTVGFARKHAGPVDDRMREIAGILLPSQGDIAERQMEDLENWTLLMQTMGYRVETNELSPQTEKPTHPGS